MLYILKRYASCFCCIYLEIESQFPLPPLLPLPINSTGMHTTRRNQKSGLTLAFLKRAQHSNSHVSWQLQSVVWLGRLNTSSSKGLDYRNWMDYRVTKANNYFNDVKLFARSRCARETSLQILPNRRLIRRLHSNLIKRMKLSECRLFSRLLVLFVICPSHCRLC